MRGEFINRRRRVLYGLLFVDIFELCHTTKFTLFRNNLVLCRGVTRFLYILITSYLDLLLCFYRTIFSYFGIFRLRFGICRLFIASEICETICISSIEIIRTTRSIRSNIDLTSIYRRLITRSFAFTNSFGRANSIWSFSDY